MENQAKKWMEKAKEAKSPEEILELCKENEYPLTEEEAKTLFQSLHTEGELSDEELDSASGGGCTSKTKVQGKKYTVVTMWCACFTGQFTPGSKTEYYRYGDDGFGDCLRKDHVSLRETWRRGMATDAVRCGNCYHLEFNGGIGYCGKSGE